MGTIGSNRVFVNKLVFLFFFVSIYWFYTFTTMSFAPLDLNMYCFITGYGAIGRALKSGSQLFIKLQVYFSNCECCVIFCRNQFVFLVCYCPLKLQKRVFNSKIVFKTHNACWTMDDSNIFSSGYCPRLN